MTEELENAIADWENHSRVFRAIDQRAHAASLWVEDVQPDGFRWRCELTVEGSDPTPHEADGSLVEALLNIAVGVLRARNNPELTRYHANYLRSLFEEQSKAKYGAAFEPVRISVPPMVGIADVLKQQGLQAVEQK